MVDATLCNTLLHFSEWEKQSVLYVHDITASAALEL